MSATMNSKAKENMKDFPYGDLDWYLWLLLFRARDIVFKARRKELSLYDLSCIEFYINYFSKKIFGYILSTLNSPYF